VGSVRFLMMSICFLMRSIGNLFGIMLRIRAYRFIKVLVVFPWIWAIFGILLMSIGTLRIIHILRRFVRALLVMLWLSITTSNVIGMPIVSTILFIVNTPGLGVRLMLFVIRMKIFLGMIILQMSPKHWFVLVVLRMTIKIWLFVDMLGMRIGRPLRVTQVDIEI
jgi:hypothetical protein